MAKKKSTGIDWMGLAKAVIKAATASPTPMHSGGERRGRVAMRPTPLKQPAYAKASTFAEATVDKSAR